MTRPLWTRRDALIAGASLSMTPLLSRTEERMMIDRSIPASDERLPVIGLGTYRVFDVDRAPTEIAKRREIIELLLGEGGSVIDTSAPTMLDALLHGSSEIGRNSRSGSSTCGGVFQCTFAVALSALATI